MGTIDISYYNLFIGLLLLAIPFFYLWKFKTGLLKPAVIGTLRMIIQLFFIGMYLKYLFLWNNPWINFLWVIIMVFVAGQTALVRTQLKRSVLLIPITVGFLCQLVLVKTLEERYFANATNIFTEREANKILKKGCAPKIQEVTRPLYERVQGKDAVTKMQYVDMHLWLVHDILMKGDKMGMANSLEVRVPFLDKEVLKLAQTLPLDYKVRAPRTKVALRAAAERNIRSKTAEKKKLGFPIPIRVWLREEKYYNRVRAMFASSAAKKFFDTDMLMKMLEDHREGKNTNEKTDDSRKIWTVYIFLVWYDRFFEHGKPVHPSVNTRQVNIR